MVLGGMYLDAVRLPRTSGQSRRIVSEAYGAPVNMPAGAGRVLARQLHRTWRDGRGVTFDSRVTAAYDADARVVNMSNAWLVTSWIRTARW